MTRICPEPVPETCQAIFSHMEVLSARFSTLATPGGLLALLDLTRLQPLLEEEEGLRFLTTLLSPDEARLFAGYTYPKRRLEWLGGRLAAKHCLSRLASVGKAAPSCYREFSLLPDASGRPTLAQPSDLENISAISISHSRGYAAALVVANGDACGIDIQRKSPQLARVQERFASEEELALLQRVTVPLTRLAMLWTAKEAVKKCLLADQPTQFDTIRLTEMTYEPKGAIWTARCQLKGGIGITPLVSMVKIAEFGDYLIACTMRDRHA